MLDPKFVIIGTLIGLGGSLYYLINTIRGNVKPNRVSFLLWSIFPFIVFTAQIRQGVGIESMMTLSKGVFAFMIFLASFWNKQAVWKVTRFDLMCGAISLVGFPLWMITRVGNIAILFSIFADALAAVPTFVKAYKYPETELSWPWLASSVGAILTLLTISHWNFANSSFVIYLVIGNAFVFSLTQFKLGRKMRSLYQSVAHRFAVVRSSL